LESFQHIQPQVKIGILTKSGNRFNNFSGVNNLNGCSLTLKFKKGFINSNLNSQKEQALRRGASGFRLLISFPETKIIITNRTNVFVSLNLCYNNQNYIFLKRLVKR